MAEVKQAPKISIYMITYNNERTVERALESITWADEIVVVDSFSNDKTVEICRKFTDNVFQRKWPGHRDQYQYAVDLTTHPWVLFVDADEEVPPKLAEEIRRVVEPERRWRGRVHRLSTDLLPGEMDSIRRMVSGLRDPPLSKG